MTPCPVYERESGRLYRANQFITPRDTFVISKAREIINSLRYGQNDSSINRIISAYNFVSVEIEYVYDEDQHGYTDYWQFPSETLSFGTGDCEDTSFLLSSLIIALRIDPRYVRVVLGVVRVEGHAWVEVLIDSNWYVLESTADVPLTGWFVRGHDYIPETEVYLNRCVRIGNIGTYNRYPLRY